MPSPTHVGGLRYHGMSPMLSHLVHNGHMEPRAYGQKECLEAGIQFARTEGIMLHLKLLTRLKVLLMRLLSVKPRVNQKLFYSIFVGMVILICKHIWIIFQAILLKINSILKLLKSLWHQYLL